MSYTLRQVQPLLTRPELELFQASRAGAIKEIAPHRLASKIQRARALRDKYRDLYQRQTVQTRTGGPKGRKPMGGENTRTQTKGDIMDDVLKRFEARQQTLQSQPDKPAQPASRRSATVAKPAARKAARAPATKAPAKKPEVSMSTLAAGVKRLQNIVKAVRKAVVADATASSKKPVTRRKASDTTPDAALASAPTDITPKAKRVNPLKSTPVNQKIHASARSRTSATQARRDAR